MDMADKAVWIKTVCIQPLNSFIMWRMILYFRKYCTKFVVMKDTYFLEKNTDKIKNTNEISEKNIHY